MKKHSVEVTYHKAVSRHHKHRLQVMIRHHLKVQKLLGKLVEVMNEQARFIQEQ